MQYINKIAGKAETKIVSVGGKTYNPKVVKILYNNGNEYLPKHRKPTEIDYSPYFVYTLQEYNGETWAMITEVKYQAWYDAFGNYDIVIPETIESKPTMLKAI